MTVQVLQGPQQTSEQWVVNSLDGTLANIGGYSGLIWMIVFFLVSDYSKFKMDSSMVQALYQYQTSHNSTQEKSDEEVLDEWYLAKDLKDRKQFKISFCEHLIARMLSCFSCCCSG